MSRVTALYRHPIKSHGREELDRVTLRSGKTFPWDRVWAVAHDAAKFDKDAPEWAHCANFSRGAKAAELMAMNARMDEANNIVHLSHPKLGDIAINPDDANDAAALISWVKPIMPADRAQSAFIAKAPDRGMTDTPFPSISINSVETNAAISAAVGADLSPLRWRGNIWIDGFDAWEEFNWVGKKIRIGETLLDVRERITRCRATTVNPETGISDVDTLEALSTTWGHQDFGVYVVVLEGGEIKTDDAVEILS